VLHTPHHQISRVYKKMGRADLTFCPEASVLQPIQVKGNWLPQPPPSSTLRSGSFVWTRVMEAPQAQWLWPCRQKKSKKKWPQEASRPSRSRTTLGRPGIKTPLRTAKVDSGVTSQSSRVGHRVPMRRHEAKRPHSSPAPTARRRSLPSRVGATSRLKPLPRTTRKLTRVQALGVPGQGETRTTRPIGLATGARQGLSRAAAAPRSGPVGPRRGRTRTTRTIGPATGPPQGETGHGATQVWVLLVCFFCYDRRFYRV
jgi:hypothetical protein